MTEKELKRLNRYQLLELLIMQTNRADTLEAQLEKVQEMLEAGEEADREAGEEDLYPDAD